jgi:ArsR family transcriptional regulator
MLPVLTSIKSLSEEIRLRILLLLNDRDACVCELMEVFGMAQSKLSHHLITLRDAGLLISDRRGKWNYYRVDTQRLNPVNRELVASLAKWTIDDATIAKDLRSLVQVKRRMQICC